MGAIGECDLMLASAAPDGRRLVVPGALRASGSREPPTSRTPSPSLALGFHDAVPSVTRWQLRMARWIGGGTGRSGVPARGDASRPCAGV